MKWGVALLLGGAVLAAGYGVAGAVWPASGLAVAADGKAPVFPDVTAANLEGKRYALPREFDGEMNLCLIAFTREQQDDVNTWLDGVKPLQNTPGLEVYELPTLYRGTPAFRGWLDGVMRQGIPDKRQRERTITLYLDKPAFRKTLDLPDEKRIYALLVDRKGKILWRAEGLFSEEKGKALGKALEAAKDKPTRQP